MTTFVVASAIYLLLGVALVCICAYSAPATFGEAVKEIGLAPLAITITLLWPLGVVMALVWQAIENAHNAGRRREALRK